MNILQNFSSPNLIKQILPSQPLSPKIDTYNKYFEKKIKQKIPQLYQQHTSKTSSISSRNLDSKQFFSQSSKPSRVGSKNKKDLRKKVKKSINDYKIDSMYASKISQMASQISIPIHQNKSSKKQLMLLESKIINEILSLREQKITALQNLNRLVDRKNKALQFLKSYEMLKEKEILNAENGIEDNTISSKPTYETITYDFSKIESQYLSRHSKKSNRPAEVINSKISKYLNRMENAFIEANKIKDELMKPLIQHPILIRNSELKAELEQLKQQLEASYKDRSSIESEIEAYKNENENLSKELQKNKLKLSSLESKRFETFFPKDRQRNDQIRKLIEMEKELQQRKQQLEQELLRHSIITKTQQELMIEQLREENRQLLQSCQRFYKSGISENYDDGYSQMSVNELEELVGREMDNKKIVEEMMGQLEQKIWDLERENERMRKGSWGSYDF